MFCSDVIRSAIGTAFWVILLLAWNIIFQLYRPKMGRLGDFLIFVSPRD